MIIEVTGDQAIQIGAAMVAVVIYIAGGITLRRCTVPNDEEWNAAGHGIAFLLSIVWVPAMAIIFSVYGFLWLIGFLVTGKR